MTRAHVEERDGELVLVDPDALEVIRAVSEHNCELVFEGQLDRVAHFKRRIAERGETSEDRVIVLVHADDDYGQILAEVLMPDQDWQPFRDRGEKLFARGLADRSTFTQALAETHPDAAKKLDAIRGTAVVVVDYGVVAVFEAP